LHAALLISNTGVLRLESEEKDNLSKSAPTCVSREKTATGAHKCRDCKCVCHPIQPCSTSKKIVFFELIFTNVFLEDGLWCFSDLSTLPKI
jgi:hypothetical protein